MPILTQADCTSAALDNLLLFSIDARWRVVTSHALPRDTHSSGILKYLHWLPIEQRIRFKLATLTDNTLCSTQPAYLRSLLNYHTPTRGLRSANTNLLSAARVRTTFASRGFSVAAPTVWNSLPSGICDSSSTHSFRRLLKTRCCQLVFGSPWWCMQVPQIRPLADIVHSKYSFSYLLVCQFLDRTDKGQPYSCTICWHCAIIFF